MKKAISILLTAVILISACCVSAFAAETPKTDALLDSFETESEVSVTFRSGQSSIFAIFGQNPANTVAVKDNKVAYELDNGFITIKVVANDDGVYAYIPAFPYIYVKLDTEILEVADVWSIMGELTNLTQGFIQYIKTYSETVDGVEYTVEEYNDREFVTSKFYYDAKGNLAMLKVENSATKSVQYTYFEDISFEVEDDYFDVPVLAINATPFLQALFVALLGSSFAA